MVKSHRGERPAQKAWQRPRQVRSVKANASEPLMKNLSQMITGPRWAGNGPDARKSDDATQALRVVEER